jgi:hypothetical protein
VKESEAMYTSKIDTHLKVHLQKSSLQNAISFEGLFNKVLAQREGREDELWLEEKILEIERLSTLDQYMAWELIMSVFQRITRDRGLSLRGLIENQPALSLDELWMNGELIEKVIHSLKQYLSSMREEGRRCDEGDDKSSASLMRIDGEGESKEANSADSANEQKNRRATLHGLLRRIQLLLREGKHEMRIQLRPEHLGGLCIKIVQNGEAVEINFLTSNPEVKRLLEENLPSLLEALRSAEIEVNKISISLVDVEPQFFRTGKGDPLQEEEEEEVLIHDSRLPWLAGVVDFVA